MTAHDWTTRARVSGIIAAILASAIYGLVGLGWLSVGESTTEVTTTTAAPTTTTAPPTASS